MALSGGQVLKGDCGQKMRDLGQRQEAREALGDLTFPYYADTVRQCEYGNMVIPFGRTAVETCKSQPVQGRYLPFSWRLRRGLDGLQGRHHAVGFTVCGVGKETRRLAAPHALPAYPKPAPADATRQESAAKNSRPKSETVKDVFQL